MWSIRAATVLTVLALALGAMPAPVGSSAASACGPSTADPVWFGAVVYDDVDDPPRDDFQRDVDNFHLLLDALRGTYCIPDDQVRILAFEQGYTRAGITYDEASLANVDQMIEDFGAAASPHDDALFFFFLSSHGLVYAAANCPGGLRSPGSYASLKGGDLLDCKLGAALNDNFDHDTRMAIVVDCSLCGGFSDSLTAASGTAPDNANPRPSGVVRANRIVVTGCAMTTECFGSDDGAVLLKHMGRVLAQPNAAVDGWMTPGFPLVQGANLPAPVGVQDGRMGFSELVFGAVWSAYTSGDVIAVQEQFRMKYRLDSLAEDILVRA